MEGETGFNREELNAAGARDGDRGGRGVRKWRGQRERGELGASPEVPAYQVKE